MEAQTANGEADHPRRMQQQAERRRVFVAVVGVHVRLTLPGLKNAFHAVGTCFDSTPPRLNLGRPRRLQFNSAKGVEIP